MSASDFSSLRSVSLSLQKSHPRRVTPTWKITRFLCAEHRNTSTNVENSLLSLNMPVATRRNARDQPAEQPPAPARAQNRREQVNAPNEDRVIEQGFDAAMIQDPEPPRRPFKARNPAWVSEEPIDFSSRDGQVFYKAASDPLPEKFDGEAKKLHLFLGRLQARAQRYAWIPMLT